jgi:hypothetical protein
MSIERLRNALESHDVPPEVVDRMMEGYEGITDRSKAKRPAFFIQAMRVMDETLDFHKRCQVRAACGCSNGGWREKEMRRIAREYKGKGLAEHIEAIGQVRYMGFPILHEDGTISGGVGTQGGFDCPCPVFHGWKYEEPVPATYCLCCGGHFQYHYQIALGVKLRLKEVLSTALESMRRERCRFVYEVVPEEPEAGPQR